MTTRKSWIWVTFQKEGIHCYPDAPTGVEFLRHDHRHMFHFRVKIEVFHQDRDIEFILLKRELETLYRDNTLQLNHMSCEMICDQLHDYISDKYPNRDIVIDVSEDLENGATVEYFK